MSNFIITFFMLTIFSASFAQRNPLPKDPSPVRIPHDPTGQGTWNSGNHSSQKIKNPTLSKVISGLNNPESVYINNKSVFVSEMGKSTDSTERDGNILKYNLSGRLDSEFVLKEKLVSPMGMTSFNGVLYIADVNKVVGLSTGNGEKVNEFDLSREGATFLNDIIVIKRRYLLVSATDLKKIFIIDLKTNTVNDMKFDLRGQAPNGLAYDAAKSLVYVVANNQHILGDYGNGSVFIFSIAPDNRIKVLEKTSIGHFLDGIAIKDNQLIVSDWFDRGNGSKLYYLDRRSLQLKGSYATLTGGLADFDYSEFFNVLILPDLINGKIYFYRQ